MFATSSNCVEELRDRRSVPRRWMESTAKRLEGLVLVVEDNRDMSRFIAEGLRSRGFRVAAAFDGRDGYDKAIAERPDLVLTDLMMPVMSGDELVRSLRAETRTELDADRRAHGQSRQELRVRLLREGAQDYLDKPFSVEELCARVQNLVARKRAEDHSTTAPADRGCRACRHGRLRSGCWPPAGKRAGRSRDTRVECQEPHVRRVRCRRDWHRPAAALLRTLGVRRHESLSWPSKIGGRPRPVGLLGLVPRKTGSSGFATCESCRRIRASPRTIRT